MAHILVIEDDSMLAALEKDFLEVNEFTVTVAATGKEGLKALYGWVSSLSKTAQYKQCADSFYYSKKQ